jgi:hypothetical protein
MRTDRVAGLLLERGQITRRQYDEAVRARGFFGGELESHLLKLGHVSEDVLGSALAEHFGLPYASAEVLRSISPEARSAVRRDILERLEACPFAVDGRTLRVAMLDPRDRTVPAEIERATGMRVEPWVTCEVRLHAALERHFRIRPHGVRPIAPAPPDPRLAAAEAGSGETATPAPGDPEAAGMGLDGLPLDHVPPADEIAAADWTSSPQAQAWLDGARSGDEEPPIFPARAPAVAPRTTRELGEALADARTRDEIADAVLGFALGTAPRAALFASGKGRIRGVAGVGRGLDDVRKVSVPPGSGTIFDLVGASGESYVGPVPPLPANRDLYTALGGRLPRQVMLVPIPVSGRISAYLYVDGDDRPLDRPDLPTARRVAAMTGLAFEMLLLRTKLREG